MHVEEMLWDEPMEVYASLVRSAICAPEGKVFMDRDFSGIENRVAAWVSGDEKTLDRFRGGFDQYIDFATEMYRCKYDEVTKDQRQVAKSAVLGCVYGQGWKGFIDYAAGFGVTITPEESREIVGHFRKVYSKTADLWRTFGHKAVEAVQRPGETVGINALLQFRVSGDWLQLTLPSGRCINWYKPLVEKRAMVRRTVPDAPWQSEDPERAERLDRGEWDVWIFDAVTAMSVNTRTRQWCRNQLPGYTLFQSAVQGTARDFLTHAMGNVEAAGMPVVMTVHDEIISLVDEDQADEARFADIMNHVPHWAQGFPLASDGWVGKRYRK